MECRSYWTLPGGRGEIRVESVADPGPGEALVETIVSGVSRGTESLVHLGRVPERVRDLMRAPFQRGELPGEVCYGYLSVGEVAAVGPDTPTDLVGHRVFCLYPHVDRYVVPLTSLTPVPEEVPSERAVLAGAVETAVNALWDGGPRLGDRIAVVGGGMIGMSVAALLRRFPLERLELLDPDPAVAERARAFGLTCTDPADGLGECDLVFHASATAAGLTRSLELLGDEGEVVELSWYGTTEPEVPLGMDFHARRLRLRASQVGMVSESRRARRSTSDRLATALAALADPAFDVLLTGPVDLQELPDVMDAVAHGRTPAICHVVRHR